MSLQEVQSNGSWDIKARTAINTAIRKIKDATTTVVGQVRLATNAETTTGTATDIATTPAGVAAAIDADVATHDANAAAHSAAFAAYSVMRGGWRNIVGSNGGMEVWQRGAGGSASIAVAASTTAYTADRWYITTDANEASTVSQQTGLVSASRFCARVQRDSGQTGTGAMVFGYPFDTGEVVPLRGSVVTLRVILRGGDDWSPASGTLSIVLAFGTGAAAKRGAGFTGETTPISTSTNLTADGTTVATFNVTSSTLATNITQGELQFRWTPVGTASTNDYFEIDDVMLEIAPSVAAFERRPFEDELRACMRHFQKSFNYATAPAQSVGSGTGEYSWRSTATGAVTTTSPTFVFPVTMRSAPTATVYNPNAANAQIRNQTDTTDFTGSSASTLGENTKFALSGTAPAGTAVNELLAAHTTHDAGI